MKIIKQILSFITVFVMLSSAALAVADCGGTCSASQICCFTGGFKDPTAEWCCPNLPQYPGDQCGETANTCVDCLDQCSPSGARECVGSGSYKICGNYDADPCLEWDLRNCLTGTTCNEATGQCITTCPYNLDCQPLCPAGYSCNSLTIPLCKNIACDQDTCWCTNCVDNDLGSACVKVGSSNAYTCSTPFYQYTSCDDTTPLKYYPLKKCSDAANPNNFCTGVYGSGYYCDSGHCCETGWFWNGIKCEEAAHCNYACPWNPPPNPDPEYWFEPGCVYIGATECCCVTGNYGDPNFKEYLPIKVF